jgi:hypothetical protein
MSNFLYKNIFLYIDILFKAAIQGSATCSGRDIDNYLLLSKEPVQGQSLSSSFAACTDKSPGKSLSSGGRLGSSQPEGGNKNNDNNKNRKIFNFLKKIKNFIFKHYEKILLILSLFLLLSCIILLFFVETSTDYKRVLQVVSCYAFCSSLFFWFRILPEKNRVDIINYPFLLGGFFSWIWRYTDSDSEPGSSSNLGSDLDSGAESGVTSNSASTSQSEPGYDMCDVDETNSDKDNNANAAQTQQQDNSNNSSINNENNNTNNTASTSNSTNTVSQPQTQQHNTNYDTPVQGQQGSNIPRNYGCLNLTDYFSDPKKKT